MSLSQPRDAGVRSHLQAEAKHYGTLLKDAIARNTTQFCFYARFRQASESATSGTQAPA